MSTLKKTLKLGTMIAISVMAMQAWAGDPQRMQQWMLEHAQRSAGMEVSNHSETFRNSEVHKSREFERGYQRGYQDGMRQNPRMRCGPMERATSRGCIRVRSDQESRYEDSYFNKDGRADEALRRMERKMKERQGREWNNDEDAVEYEGSRRSRSWQRDEYENAWKQSSREPRF